MSIKPGGRTLLLRKARSFNNHLSIRTRMSMLRHEFQTPYKIHITPELAWSEHPSAGRIDPLVDRAMAMAGAGAWSCDLCDSALTWTSGVYDMFGLPIDSTPDRTQTVTMYAEESRDALERLRKQAIAVGGSFTLDAQIRRPDGEMRWLRINGEMVWPSGGSAILHGLKQDVTDEKVRSEALRQLAENDALTGLASRGVYESRFLNTRITSLPMVPIGALVLFDLDRFKAINDRLGHGAGDACLRAFADRLSANFPEALLTARIGGDEFALIVGNDEPTGALERRVAKFLRRLRAPVLWRGHMITISATSGIAVPSNTLAYDPEELFNLADTALYAAKRARRQIDV